MTEKEKEVWRDIFELYKDMPCLWDISNANYLNRDMRNQAMEILLEKYKEVDEDANMSILKKKIENMRTSYRRELKKVKASVRTGAGTEDIYTPTLWYFELLHFLDEKNEQSRRGVDTLDSSDEDAMKGFLTSLLVYLVARSTTADPQCDVGKQIVDGVDNRIINGGWYLKYGRPKSFSQEGGGCWLYDYVLSPDGTAQLTASPTLTKDDQAFSLVATVQIVGKRNLNVTFSSAPPQFSGLSTIYYVIAWDEEQGYEIVGGCPSLLNEPLMWIGYREYPPSEASLEASKAALKKAGLKLEDFDENCE